jgi:hypothetical protein
MFALRGRAALSLITAAVLAAGLTAVAGAGEADAAATVTGIEARLPANAAANPDVLVNMLSCASAGNCTAVGRYTDSAGNSEGLLLTQTSGTWARGIEAPLPKNAATSPLVTVTSVSCASAGNCTAVGQYNDSSGLIEGFFLTQTSGTWARGIEARLPAGVTSAGNLLVSCASARNCTVVGSYTDSYPNFQGLLWTKTAGRWATAITAPLPANAATNQQVLLNQVSCRSAGNCTAVGSYLDSTGNTQGLLLTQTSGTWATGVEARLPASPSGLGGSLTSVSCASAGNCTAVGTYFDSSGNTDGLALTQTSRAWATGVETVPPDYSENGQNLPRMTSVSCVSAGNCTAAGSYDTFAVLWTQTKRNWATGIAASLPAGAEAGGLDWVSCPSAGNCTAVGSYDDSSGNQQGIVLGQTSGTWSPTEVPVPANAGTDPSVTMWSVSCASAGNCTAVGRYTDSAGNTQGLLVTLSNG